MIKRLNFTAQSLNHKPLQLTIKQAMKKKNITLWIIAAILLWLVVLLVCSLFGSVHSSPLEILKLWYANIPFISHSENTLKLDLIYWQIRLPRLILATLTGMALASTGTAFQSVFRNQWQIRMF